MSIEVVNGGVGQGILPDFTHQGGQCFAYQDCADLFPLIVQNWPDHVQVISPGGPGQPGVLVSPTLHLLIYCLCHKVPLAEDRLAAGSAIILQLATAAVAQRQ